MVIIYTRRAAAKRFHIRQAFAYCPNLTATVISGSYAETWCNDNGVSVIVESTSVLPESEHPYSSGTNQTWEYVHDGEAAALLVSFAPETFFFGMDAFYIEANGNADYYEVGRLSGLDVLIPGNAFTLRLDSYSDKMAYGFRITEIRALTEEEYLNLDHFSSMPLENGTLSITGYTGFRTDLEIPSEIGGIPVTQIRGETFIKSSLTSVRIPGSVKTINYLAFSRCSQLKEVVLVEGVEYISNDAFELCGSLTSIVLPESLSFIGTNTLSNCPMPPARRLPMFPPLPTRQFRVLQPKSPVIPAVPLTLSSRIPSTV